MILVPGETIQKKTATELGLHTIHDLTTFWEKVCHLLGTIPRNLSPGSRSQTLDFPGGAVVKNPPANAGDKGSIPGS